MKRTTLLGLAFVLGAVPAFAQDFTTLDGNGDGQLTRDEFYGGASDIGVYSDWDTSGDGLLDEDEFNELGYDWDYDSWDADSNAYVDAGEFYDGYYASYDANEDGHWDNGEWDDAGEAGLFDW